ncbi:MAG: hypothetical protein M3421_15230, partial [Bacteroidota bacterium]|nr:hypothetical protein [Bacteroidota bacterium]
MYNFKYAFILSLLLFLVVEVKGQQPSRRKTITPERTADPQSDSNNESNVQSIAPSLDTSIDTLRNENETLFSDSVSVSVNTDVQTTIVYSARDSIDLDVQNQVMYLYGDAKIKYGDINLEAYAIEINYLTNELNASAGVDS